MAKSAISVIIVHDGKGADCEASCGVDWSSEEATAPITEQLEKRFGDSVRLEYLDLSRQRTDHAAGIAGMVSDENIPLPLLLIDGRPTVSGQFDARLLLDAIDAVIEMRRIG